MSRPCAARPSAQPCRCPRAVTAQRGSASAECWPSSCKRTFCMPPASGTKAPLMGLAARPPPPAPWLLAAPGLHAPSWGLCCPRPPGTDAEAGGKDPAGTWRCRSPERAGKGSAGPSGLGDGLCPPALGGSGTGISPAHHSSAGWMWQQGGEEGVCRHPHVHGGPMGVPVVPCWCLWLCQALWGSCWHWGSLTCLSAWGCPRHSGRTIGAPQGLRDASGGGCTLEPRGRGAHQGAVQGLLGSEVHPAPHLVPHSPHGVKGSRHLEQPQA